MKKHFILSAAIVLASSIVLISCKKDEEDTKNNNNNTPPALTANISVAAPVAGTTYESGDEVHIDVTVTADFDMHGYEAYLINLTADDTLWSVDAHDHGSTYTIHEHWTNNVTEHSDMKLKVIATLDHDGSLATKEVAFHCHPM